MINYTAIFDDLIGYGMQTFDPMQPYFWLLFFGAIIGYIYGAVRSIVVTVIAIILVFGIFAGTTLSGYFSDSKVSIFSQFMYILTLVGLVLLVGALLTKRRT